MSVNTKVNGQLVKSAGLYSVSKPIGMADIYSTEEKEVGLWIDNKPLYQKTVNCGALPNNTNKNTAHGISNIDSIVCVFGTAENTTSKVTLTIPWVHRNAVSNQVQIAVTDTEVQITTATDQSSFNQTYITIQYTKTTDTPWSGKFVPQGYGYVSSGDIYSFEERQVGVWSDGKPLYQKSVDTGVLPNNSDKGVAHNISNLDKIVSVEGIGWRSASPYYVYPIPYAQTQVSYQVGLYLSDTEIHLQTMYDARAIDNSVVTLRYTKTTDVTGSGEYVPSGDKAVHYSTDEEVIGTWTDGSTLYRRTFILTGADVPVDNTPKGIDTGTVNIKSIDGYLSLGDEIMPINFYYDGYLNISARYVKSEHTVWIVAHIPNRTCSEALLTITYTKTS